MTRFARAKGSKSSNERVPEQATSWNEMRRDLQRESVRKAAEEQIARESRIELAQNVKKNTLDTSITKKKGGVVELVSFDDVPCFSGQSTQMIPKLKCSFTQKGAEKTRILSEEILHKSRQDTDTNEDSEFIEHDTNISKISINGLGRLKGDTVKSLSSLASEPGVSMSCNERINVKNSPQKAKLKNGVDNRVSSTTKKQKPHCQQKPCKLGDTDSEAKIGGNFKGYPVPVEDAETLTDAYNILRKEGLTHKQAMERIKPERRRAEKRLARLKSTICFRCRKPGHRLSDCPLGGIECDVCFKCGSTTHKYQDCKKKGSFVSAKCFICGVVGHLSAHCPENAHGVYPQGGVCKICGENTHLVKDCPQNKNKREQHSGTTEFDDYFDEKSSEPVQPKRKKIKKVQF